MPSDYCYKLRCRALHRYSIIISFVVHLVLSFRLIIFIAIYRLQLPTGKPANMGTVEKKQCLLSDYRLQLNALTNLEAEPVVPLTNSFLAEKEVAVTPQYSPPQNTGAREEFKLLLFCYYMSLHFLM